MLPPNDLVLWVLCKKGKRAGKMLSVWCKLDKGKEITASYTSVQFYHLGS